MLAQWLSLLTTGHSLNVFDTHRLRRQLKVSDNVMSTCGWMFPKEWGFETG